MSDLSVSEQIENVETIENIFEDKPEAGEVDQGEADKAEAANETEADAESTGEETAPPAEKDTDKDQKSVPIAALKDERQRRQKAEEEAQRLREKYEKQEDQQAPDPVTDPEAYEQYVEAKVAKRSLDKRISASREDMLSKHDDYEATEKLFLLLATQDPSLVQQMNDHPRPAEFAYEHAQAYRADLLKAATVQPAAKVNSKAETRKASAVKVPDLTKAPAATSNTTRQEKLAEFDEIFADQKY